MPRSAFTGARRRLVVGIDLGTSYSGVAYCLLDPGEIPNIRCVTRYPGQEHSGDSKVPSIAYYDSRGVLKAIGAEAVLPGTAEKAEELGWLKAEWWKLTLAPTKVRHDLGDEKWPPPLPRGKTISDILEDFFRYMLNCVKTFICDSHAAGDLQWKSVESDITCIISHPNGWGGTQQSILRRAAIRAGLAADTIEGLSQITFVTEGEASFNYCANNGLSNDALKVGQNVMIIDAGGGTLDLSPYTVIGTSPLSVEETFQPACSMNGAEFVTFRAGRYIHEKLRSSPFDSRDNIAAMVEAFDNPVKRRFKDLDEVVWLKFGSARDSDPKRNIVKGKLKLTGAQVASFFEPSLIAIVETIENHLYELGGLTTHALLVGGFGSSPWVFSQLKNRLSRIGVTLSRPDGPTSKAVAEGAVAFYLDHHVTSRIARFTYGMKCSRNYNPLDPEHLSRRENTFLSPAGDMLIIGAFESIITQGTKVRGSQEFSQNFVKTVGGAQELSLIKAFIVCYKGTHKAPGWADIEPENFQIIGYVEADTSKVPRVPKIGLLGNQYFQQDYTVILIFGLTELKAQLSWLENSQLKRSDARIIYHDEEFNS